ncbi:uncharacterized protein TNCV_1618041 [Trichonephila clavipes]|nr:uncharacterized protein TNCV_1618041 [Trichonephila clavipes]
MGRRWGGVKGSTRYGRRDPKCSSARRLRMFREDTGAPNEGATCAWMAADEAVGCTRSFLTMWWSSQRLGCRGRPEPVGLYNANQACAWELNTGASHQTDNLTGTSAHTPQRSRSRKLSAMGHNRATQKRPPDNKRPAGCTQDEYHGLKQSPPVISFLVDNI